MVVAPTRIPSLRSSPSRLDIAYPILPLAEGVGLTVGAMTWEGRLSFGLTADAAIVPDLDRLAAAVTESFEELVMAADKDRPRLGRGCGPCARGSAGPVSGRGRADCFAVGIGQPSKNRLSEIEAQDTGQLHLHP